MSEVKENAAPHPGAEPAQATAQPPGVIAKVIADQLEETEIGPRRLILRLVKYLGIDMRSPSSNRHWGWKSKED
ncbi:hypothetical protein KSC_106110 [Ktedonobacter sp. SOSP1-52]|uniref:hypothetical protein n=1 Tax=Ktedonobacter sp. SOSP1-52 TaxID=2778366 RepID=UPI001914DC77|nr:hypothetical protein [Ktedonobacter sp. SOSP1-52]GHO71719.1 hypothetical protein KSC_106110 [Ktedonobacter sp. SOSP1-52]